MSIELTGKVTGSVSTHTPESLQKVFNKSFTCFMQPDGTLFEGLLEDVTDGAAKRPVVIFIHGSSGINPATRLFGERLARRGYAFVAPDSMQTPDRLAYSSPVAREVYEKIHRMRYDELQYAVLQLNSLPFFDGRWVIAGTSEGAVSVARFINTTPNKEAGRLIFSWSCENNYHVTEHASHIPLDCPVMNIMSADDPYFSTKNPYLDCPGALGYAKEALKDHTDAAIVLLPGAPHTLFNLPQAASLIEAFLDRVTGRKG